jgi:hypothetical protein
MARGWGWPATANKYGNKKLTIDGETWDSQKEYQRWCELRLLERCGKIQDLKRQVPFLLIPTQREPGTTGPRGGFHPGKLLEKECTYVADFAYIENGEKVVEDTKSEATKTEAYIIKRKLMLYKYGIRIREV